MEENYTNKELDGYEKTSTAQPLPLAAAPSR